MTVPCYLFAELRARRPFQLGPARPPDPNGTWDANFDCIIPRSAVEGPPSPARPSLLGHGLFLNATDVAAGGPGHSPAH